ncbi:MAG: repeat-containing protein [Pedosphaera sp.]|nr:repeat-containing protein [Pedosphaera sp.]
MLIFVLLLVGGTFCFWLWRGHESAHAYRLPSVEPVYKGKPLSEWTSEVRIDVLKNGSHPPVAVEAIKAFGPAAVPFLLKWLEPAEQTNSTVPGGVEAAFEVLGPEAKSAIPGLAKLLDKYQPREPTPISKAWHEVEMVLAHVGYKPKPQNFLKNYSAWSYAASSLSHLGPEAVPAMLRAAKNVQGQHIQWEIILNMGNFGTNGAAAIPALIVWAHDKDAWVRAGAVSALGNIAREPGMVVPVLSAKLKDPDPLVRRYTAGALGYFGKDARVATPELIRTLDDPEWDVRRETILTLASIGERPEIVVPLLAKKLQDIDERVRRDAGLALGEIGGQAAFDALMVATDDPDMDARSTIFEALRKIDAKALEKSGKRFLHKDAPISRGE